MPRTKSFTTRSGQVRFYTRMGRHKHPDVQQRFWEKVNKSGPTRPHMTSNCWEWSIQPSRRYGLFWLEGRYEEAHRVAYAWSRKIRIPDLNGLVVRHTCDNSRCCRPDHLSAGSQQQNIDDMIARGRHAKQTGNLSPPPVHAGLTHHKASLSKDQVLQVRSRLAAGQKPTAISRAMRVGRMAVRRLEQGLSYQDVR